MIVDHLVQRRAERRRVRVVDQSVVAGRGLSVRDRRQGDERPGDKGRAASGDEHPRTSKDSDQSDETSLKTHVQAAVGDGASSVRQTQPGASPADLRRFPASRGERTMAAAADSRPINDARGTILAGGIAVVAEVNNYLLPAWMIGMGVWLMRASRAR